MLTTDLGSGLRSSQNLEDDAGLEFRFESSMFCHLWIPLSGLYAVDQKLSSFWGPLQSIVNLARTDLSRIPIIRSPLRHQNQLCGEPPIADHSRHCIPAIEKLRFRKGAERNLHPDRR